MCGPLEQGLAYTVSSTYSTALKVAALEEVRKAKDVEIEKYKKYLNKAKKIIENIGDSKSQAEDSLEVSEHGVCGWISLKGERERERERERYFII